MANYQVRGARLSFAASGADGAQAIPRVIGLEGGGFAVTWLGADNQRTEFDGDLYAQLFDANLTATSAQPLRLITDTGPAPSFPVNQAITNLQGGGFALFSNDNARQAGTGPVTEAALRLYDANGAALSSPIYVGASTLLGTTITTLSDGRLVAGWIDTNGALRAQYFTAQGGPIGASFELARPAGEVAARPDFAALGSGGWVATFVGQSSQAATALFYDAAGNVIANRVVATNLAAIEGVQTFELADDRVILVWSKQRSGQPLETRAQIYSLEGTKVGAEIAVSNTASSVVSVTGLADGGFVIATEGGSSARIDVQVYDSIGQQNGSSFGLTDAFGPSVSALQDGGFVLTWQNSVTRQFNAQAYQAFAVGDLTKNGTAANDTLAGAEGNDQLMGFAGNDQLYGSVGDDQIFGGDGNDLLDGGDGNDSAFGGAGEDVISGGSGRTIAEGGAGADRFVLAYASSPAGVSSYLGGDGVDTLDMSRITTAILFQTTTNRVIAGGNFIGEVETFIAGSGADRFDMSNFVFETRLEGGGGDDRFIGSFNAAEIMLGGEGTDSFDTVNGFDQAYGENGADSFLVNARYGGAPTTGIVDGGAGVDTVQLSVGFTVDLAAGTAQAGDSTFSLIGIEVVLAAAFAGFNSTFRGTSQNDNLVLNPIYSDTTAGVTFFGREGDDVLSGGLGDDNLFGGTGNDIIRGGSGVTIAEGNEGNDLFIVTSVRSNGVLSSYTGGDGIDSLDLSAISTALTFDTNTPFANTVAVGDIFAGSIEAFTGGSANDTLDFTSFTFGTGLYGSGGDDLIRGGSNIDRLEGGDGTDTIFGNGGADFLRGEGGADSLFGGNGADTFIFDLGGGTDTVGDFSLAGDIIDVTSFDFNSASQILAWGQQTGPHSTFFLPTGETIVLLNTSLTQLNANHFII